MNTMWAYMMLYYEDCSGNNIHRLGTVYMKGHIKGYKQRYCTNCPTVAEWGQYPSNDYVLQSISPDN